MASQKFLTAYNARVKPNEGGFVNDPSDSGGYTYCGITRKNFPEWKGWPIVESVNLHKGQILPELAPLVEDFYEAHFWNALRAEEWDDQEFAAKMLDTSVNMGIHEAIKETQESVGVAVTGKIDDETVKNC